MGEPDSSTLTTVTLTDTELRLNERILVAVAAFIDTSEPERVLAIARALSDNLEGRQREVLQLWERFAPETVVGS